jgi:hypothetical protein
MMKTDGFLTELEDARQNALSKNKTPLMYLQIHLSQTTTGTNAGLPQQATLQTSWLYKLCPLVLALAR